MTSVAAEPVVVIRRTKTAGYQVIYQSANGTRIVRARNLDYVAALQTGAAIAKTHDCLMEAEQ